MSAFSASLSALPRVVTVEHDPHDGTEYGADRVRVTFTNGYTASVVRGFGSYGGDRGLWEVAVMHGGEIVYDTPVTDDVIGCVHSEELPEMLGRVALLPERGHL